MQGRRMKKKMFEGRARAHDGHALMAVTCSLSTWILDLGTLNHMVSNN